MNRTREYNKIVQTSNIPQRLIYKPDTLLNELFIIDKRIKSNLSNILKCKYEVFNVRNKITDVQNMCQDILNKLKDISITYTNPQEEDVYNTCFNILKSRINEYKLQTIFYLRKCESDHNNKKQSYHKLVSTETENEPKNSINNPSYIQQEILQEEVNIRLRRQDSTQREISQQISEIGNLMEEIGIHVSLQEESFKRIDDLMKQSDKFLDSSLFILKKGIEGVTSTRKSLIKFFMFWIILAIIFWMFRR